jgi:hypothetical protein
MWTILPALASWPIQAQESRVESNSCIASVAQGCIQGSIAEEVGTPLKGIEVDILPAGKLGDERWDQKKSAWTDSKESMLWAKSYPGSI